MQMVGLYGLHSRGILHRDIKPSNLLIDHKGHLLISDFGLAKVFRVNTARVAPPYCTGSTKHLSGSPYLMGGFCGTIDYMAPEIISRDQYGFGVDYWAAGITLFEMLTGKVIGSSHCELHRLTTAFQGSLVRRERGADGGEDLLCATSKGYYGSQRTTFALPCKKVPSPC